MSKSKSKKSKTNISVNSKEVAVVKRFTYEKVEHVFLALCDAFDVDFSEDEEFSLELISHFHLFLKSAGWTDDQFFDEFYEHLEQDCEHDHESCDHEHENHEANLKEEVNENYKKLQDSSKKPN